MYHRYPYGSFAEYSEECIRSNRRGLVINARVVGMDIEGQQRKESVWFGTKRFILPRAAKCERLSEANTIRETAYLLLIVRC